MLTHHIAATIESSRNQESDSFIHTTSRVNNMTVESASKKDLNRKISIPHAILPTKPSLLGDETSKKDKKTVTLNNSRAIMSSSITAPYPNQNSGKNMTISNTHLSPTIRKLYSQRSAM